MSTTLFRLGLWIVIASLGLFIYSTSFEDAPFAHLIEGSLIQHVLILAGLSIAAGFVMKIFEKTKSKSPLKGKCQVCGTAVVAGAIYCRPHLRGMLEREDRKTHSTRIR